jgi:hypothetical protein
MPDTPTTPDVFSDMFRKYEHKDGHGMPAVAPGDIPSLMNENSTDSPMIVKVTSLAKKAREFKLRRESLESNCKLISCNRQHFNVVCFGGE